MSRRLKGAWAHAVMAINARAALTGNSSMIECDVCKTHRVMTGITRRVGSNMGRALAGGSGAVMAVGTLIIGLRVIDSRQ